ncbi:MAG TPA: FtsH protease activity modulator HflK [Gammaproteobacteria bacterium]
MAWDDGNKGNPWRPGGGKGPADLDAIVKEFQRKLAALFGGRGPARTGDGSGGAGSAGSALVATALVLLACVWLFSGFYKVDAAERGIVLRFGEYQATTQPGLRWHWPWPIETVEKINTQRTETWSYQGSMLTRDENIVIVDLIVQYRRTDPEDYLFNVQSPEETMRDVTSSAIREVIGKNDLDFILTEGRPEIAAQTHELLQRTLDAYGTGITVFQVNLQEANFPREVEDAVQDAVKAREDKERAILSAEEYRNRILPLARGDAARQKEEAEAYRQRVIANAEGEADRFSRILAEYQKAPAITRQRLYLETLEEILASSTKVLINTDGGNNVLYLPLDQLIQQSQRRASPQNEPATVPAPMTSAPAPRTNARERATR